jgi:hypothetical protein
MTLRTGLDGLDIQDVLERRAALEQLRADITAQESRIDALAGYRTAVDRAKKTLYSAGAADVHRRLADLRLTYAKSALGLLEAPLTAEWYAEYTYEGLCSTARSEGAQRIAASLFESMGHSIAHHLNFAMMMFSCSRLTAGWTRTPTTFSLSEGLTYKLLATDLKGVLVGDLKLPLDAFYIELPPGALFLYETTTGWHPLRMLVVTTGSISQEVISSAGLDDPDNPNYTRPGNRMIIECYGAPNANSSGPEDDAWGFHAYEIFEPARPLDDLFTKDLSASRLVGPEALQMRLGDTGQVRDAREMRAVLAKFVMNLTVYMGSERAESRLRHQETITKLLDGKKRKNLRSSVRQKIERLEQDRIFDIGTSVVIDQEFKSYVTTGKGTGASLSYRVLVRGHWRNQAHGPGRALRRMKWIEPHIRGAELPTQIVGHTYEVKE